MKYWIKGDLGSGWWWLLLVTAMTFGAIWLFGGEPPK